MLDASTGLGFEFEAFDVKKYDGHQLTTMMVTTDKQTGDIFLSTIKPEEFQSRVQATLASKLENPIKHSVWMENIDDGSVLVSCCCGDFREEIVGARAHERALRMYDGHIAVENAAMERMVL